MSWVIPAIGVAAGAAVVCAMARRPATFTHEGQTYTRRPDGTFSTSTGTVVGGTAAIAALSLAYEKSQPKGEFVGDSGGSAATPGWLSGPFGQGGSGGEGGGTDGGGGGGGD